MKSLIVVFPLLLIACSFLITGTAVGTFAQETKSFSDDFSTADLEVPVPPPWSPPHASSTFPGGVTPPTLYIESPSGQYIYVNGVPLRLTLKIADPDPSNLAYVSGRGYSYSLDGQPFVTTSGNEVLTGLSKGTHRLVVYASYYVASGLEAGPYPLPSQLVTFDVVPSTPAVSVLTPENKTYNGTRIDLVFSVSEEVEGISSSDRSLIYNANENPSWLAYSLDGAANLTISGNTTLTQLSEGFHSVVVYANNTNGNIGASETIQFSVVTETEPTQLPASLLVATVVVGVVVAVAAGLLLYHRKRRKEAPQT